MIKPGRLSYLIIFSVLVLAVALRLATALFAYFAPSKIDFFSRKWAAIVLLHQGRGVAIRSGGRGRAAQAGGQAIDILDTPLSLRGLFP